MKNQTRQNVNHDRLIQLGRRLLLAAIVGLCRRLPELRRTARKARITRYFSLTNQKRTVQVRWGRFRYWRIELRESGRDWTGNRLGRHRQQPEAERST